MGRYQGQFPPSNSGKTEALYGSWSSTLRLWTHLQNHWRCGWVISQGNWNMCFRQPALLHIWQSSHHFGSSLAASDILWWMKVNIKQEHKLRYTLPRPQFLLISHMTDPGRWPSWKTRIWSLPSRRKRTRNAEEKTKPTTSEVWRRVFESVSNRWYFWGPKSGEFEKDRCVAAAWFVWN